MDEQNKNDEKDYFNFHDKEHPGFAFFGGNDKEDILTTYFYFIKNQCEKPHLWVPDVAPLKAVGGAADNAPYSQLEPHTGMPAFEKKTPDAKTLRDLRVAEGKKELSDLMKYCQTPEGIRELCEEFEEDRKDWIAGQNYRIMHNLR